MERAIGLEHLTLLDIAPPEFVSLAAAAGFDTVGLRVSPVAAETDAGSWHPAFTWRFPGDGGRSASICLNVYRS
jgi:hypothetical protein